MRTSASGGQKNRTGLNLGRLLIRPYGLTGSPTELLLAGLCIALLGVIFVAEILTPDVVVGAFALLPLLAAVWVLSGRPAVVVVIVAILFFGVAIAVESANRVTEILLGVAVFATAFIGRLYATGVASLLSSRGHIRPAINTRVASATIEGMERSSYELRSLTRRELEVARLAAEGYTAIEIGRQLNIGARTVESHISSAYSKLGISSRLQLIRMASSLGAPPHV